MKKGVLFSVMAFFLAMPFLVLAIAHSQAISGYGEQIASSIRIRSGFYFLQAVKSDLKRAGEIIGRRTALALINQVIGMGEKIDNSKEGYKEMFLNGTLHGEVISEKFSTIENWTTDVEVKSKKRGFPLNLSFYKFKIDEEPFGLNITLNYLINLTEASKEFSFNKNMKKRALISLKGLEDPIFPLNTNGLVGREFKEFNPENFTEVIISGGNGGNNGGGGVSVVLLDESEANGVDNKDKKVLITKNVSKVDSDFLGGQGKNFSAVVAEEGNMNRVNISYLEHPEALEVPDNTRVAVLGSDGEVWDLSNLSKMWKEELYVEGPGPDFFHRLENNLTANDTETGGIETFIKKSELANAGLEVDEDGSNLASVYFSDETPKTYKIRGMPESFRLDQAHLSFYDCGELAFS